MPRVKLIQEKQDVAPEHYALFDELAALRGRVSGPSTIVIYSPGLARPWNQISEYLHGHSVVDTASFELAVCATARENDCGYIWAAHQPMALKAGVSEATIDVVRNGRELAGLPAQDVAIVDYVRQLLRDNRVEGDAFETLLKQHDARWMLDLTVWIGRYAALACIINSFDVSAAAGADVLPVAAASGQASRKAVRAPLPSTRIPPVTSRDQVAVAERGAFDAVAEGRGSVRGPFSMLMYSPPLCQAVLDVSNYLRFESDLTPRLRELATIATAREKDCPYVWAAHAPAARKEGVADSTIATVRDRGDLGALSAEDRDIVDYARQLWRDHRVSQELFDRLMGRHDTRWLVELTALIGHYGVVTGVLNAMEVSPAADAEALPLG